MRVTSFPAMGTRVDAWGVSSIARLRSCFAEAEGRFSRFREDTELSTINSSGAGHHEVSSTMREVLKAADRARRLTDGLVDIGVGPAVRAWGYRNSFEHVVDVDAEPGPLRRGTWNLDGSSLTMDDRVSIDLGGVAKGWTSDRAVERGLARVVSAGGDLRSADDDTVADVADPWGRNVAAVFVGEGALATSSVVKRSWRAGSRRANHVIDPRTMSPVDTPVVSASVVASTAVDAEVGAKAVLIHGGDGLAWADLQDWIRGALVVWRDGTVFGTAGVEWEI